MKMKKKTLGIALLSTLFLVGGGLALTNHVSETSAPEAVKADGKADDGTVTWSLRYDGNSWAGDTDTVVEGTPATFSASAAQEFKLVIGNYVTEISGSNASFLVDSDNIVWGGANYNLEFNKTGNYTISIASGTYDKILASTTLTSDDVSITYTAPSTPVVTYYSSIDGELYNASKTQSGSYTMKNTTSTVASLTEPTFYGYEFAGWYSDVACATEVADTTVIAEDMTLYAKFTIASTTNVEYMIDYGNFLGDAVVHSSVSGTTTTSPVITDACELYIHYWNAAGNCGWPGIRLGTGNGGLVTVKVPSDATGMILSAYDGEFYTAETNSWVLQTADINIAAATDTGNTLHKFLQYFYVDSTTSNHRVMTGTADAGYAKIYNALTLVAAQCGTSANETTANKTIEDAWSTIKTVADASSADEPDTTSENYTAYLSHIQGMATRAGAKGMAGLMSIYDHCAAKYSDLDTPNPLVRTLVASAYYFAGNSESNNFIAIFAVIGIAGLAGGAYIFLRKKKEERA